MHPTSPSKMLDTPHLVVPPHHHEDPTSSSFASSDPTATEKIIILPGGKAMVVDWGIESFVKNFVTIAISGAVILGAAAYGLIWADKKLKQRKRPAVRVGPPNQESDHESEHVSSPSSSDN